MNEKYKTTKGEALDLAHHVEYADESVVSKTLIKKETGNITMIRGK